MSVERAVVSFGCLLRCGGKPKKRRALSVQLLALFLWLNSPNVGLAFILAEGMIGVSSFQIERLGVVPSHA